MRLYAFIVHGFALLTLLFLSPTVTSCRLDLTGLVYTAADPDRRFGQSMSYNAQSGYSSISAPSESYTLYVVADMHVDAKNIHTLDTFINQYKADAQTLPLWICLGDVVNGKGLYPMVEEHLLPISDRKVFATVGNHDLYFSEWDQWLALFKTSSYWFEIVTPSGKKDLFVSMDSGGASLGNEQTKWLRSLLAGKKGQYRHVTCFTHTNFWKRELMGSTGYYSVEETYSLASLFANNGVELVLTGHDHIRSENIFSGVTYHILGCLKPADECGYTIYTYGDTIERKYVSVK